MSCFGLRPPLHILDFCVPLNSPFPPAQPLTPTVDDIAVDSHTSPSCLQLTIKASKTDHFRTGCCLYIGLGRPLLCALSAIMNSLPLRGQSPGPLFLLSNGQPLSHTLLTLKDIFAASGIQGSFSSHSFRIGAATVAARWVFLTTLFKLWVVGIAMPTSCISGPLRRLLCKSSLFCRTDPESR